MPATDQADIVSALQPARSPALDRALIILVWCVAYAFVCGLVLADPDVWGHTLYGIRALDQGVLVEPTDPFSYTAPQARWVNHEWLTELQFALLWKYFGNPGFWMWRNLLVLIVFGCAAAELHRQRANLAASTVLLIYGAECLSQFVVFCRPQVPTFSLFTLTLVILKRYADQTVLQGRHTESELLEMTVRRNSTAAVWAIWTLPVIIAVWTNLHGGFLAGCGVIGVYTVLDFIGRVRSGWRWDFESLQLPIVATLSALATLCSPYGYGLHLMLWEHLATDQFVVEWQPLWAARQAPTYYVPLILLALALPFSRRWTWSDALVLAVIGSQALSHIRHVSLLAIACLILLPRPLSDSLPQLFRHLTSILQAPGRWYLRVIAVGLAAGMLVVLQVRSTVDMWKNGLKPWDLGVESRSPVPGMPVRAVTFLKREHLSGNLITDYGWAQFLFWQAPEFKVAFDGRYRTVYSAQLEKEFLSFLRTGRDRPQQTAMLDKYPTEIVLLPIGSGAAQYLPLRDDFVELYRDGQAAIWVKKSPRFAAIIERHLKAPLAPVEAPAWQPFPGKT